MSRVDTAAEVLAQILAAGCEPHLVTYELHEATEEKGPWIHGFMALAVLDVLRADPRLQEGIWHHLHPEVGRPRTEFRGYIDEVGPGSVQIVINTITGCFSADVDRFNTQDVVNIGGHSFGEVIPNFFRRLFGKRKGGHA
jgi:hypothetical protein